MVEIDLFHVGIYLARVYGVTVILITNNALLKSNSFSSSVASSLFAQFTILTGRPPSAPQIVVTSNLKRILLKGSETF